MLMLPLKFVSEVDKKTVGLNLYNLAKLSHLGIPVIEGVIAIPPRELFQKVLYRYLKHNLNIKDHLNNLKTELLNLPMPESLNSLDLISEISNNSKSTFDTKTLWQNLLKKWIYEIISKIEREEKALLHLTPQLVVFSGNFSTLGMGYFDEEKKHVVIKVDSGKLDFKSSSEIENLILLGNKKLFIPQIYHWVIENEKSSNPGKIRIIKVTPFTQSLQDEKVEKTENTVASLEQNTPLQKTATKIFLDFKSDTLVDYNSDGVLLNISKLDNDLINNQILSLQRFESGTKIIFYPDLELNYEKSLKFAETFLFFHNKKKVNSQIVLPETFSIDEFLNLKREYASLGIYSKGTLKIWKQFKTVSDFLNLDQYLDAGFDGAIIDLDKISKIVCGVDGEIALKESRLDWFSSIENFLKIAGLSKLIKSRKSVLITGKLAQSEELLSYLIKSGVWGIAFEQGIAGNIRNHIALLEKQALKKSSISVNERG